MVAGWDGIAIGLAPANSSNKNTINRDKCTHTAADCGQPIDYQISRRDVVD